LGLRAEEPLLEIKNLKVCFNTYYGVVKAVDIDHLKLLKGETLGLVGETGCGKTVTALTVLKLIPSPGGTIEDGEILFKGENLLSKKEAEIRKIRGKRISMIFQDPMSSLNPVFRVGDQASRIIVLHQDLQEKEAKEKVLQVFELVGLPSPARVFESYPHELSGGMRQRVMISMAISCNPDLLIADEPTSALDVTIQAQILRLLKDLRDKIGASIMLITHDLAVVAQICEKVAVMYAGSIVEFGTVESIFSRPLHPYTKMLLECIPRPGTRGRKLTAIHGFVPSLVDPPPGCRFHPRCPHVTDLCSKSRPGLVDLGDGHLVSCFLYKQGGGA
jgi:oligopeptide/dipeptide ABC transporter ATP-binding protein